MRTLPDGGFELVAEEDACNLLEIMEEDGSRSGDTQALMDPSQIIITQDEEGHLMLEGTPLQFLLGGGNQQQLQFIVNDKKG